MSFKFLKVQDKHISRFLTLKTLGSFNGNALGRIEKKWKVTLLVRPSRNPFYTTQIVMHYKCTKNFIWVDVPSIMMAMFLFSACFRELNTMEGIRISSPVDT